MTLTWTVVLSCENARGVKTTRLKMEPPDYVAEPDPLSPDPLSPDPLSHDLIAAITGQDICLRSLKTEPPDSPSDDHVTYKYVALVIKQEVDDSRAGTNFTKISQYACYINILYYLIDLSYD